MPQHLLVLKRCELTADFGMPARFKNRHVLVHHGNRHIVAEVLMNPCQARAAVPPVTGQYQVPDNEPLFHEAVVSDHNGPDHLKHRFNRL